MLGSVVNSLLLGQSAGGSVPDPLLLTGVKARDYVYAGVGPDGVSDAHGQLYAFAAGDSGDPQGAFGVAKEVNASGDNFYGTMVCRSLSGDRIFEVSDPGSDACMVAQARDAVIEDSDALTGQDTFTGSIRTIPAGRMKVGARIRFRAAIHVQAAAAAQDFELYILLDQGPVPVGGGLISGVAANTVVVIECELTVRVTGAGGKFFASSFMSDSAGGSYTYISTTPEDIDTTEDVAALVYGAFTDDAPGNLAKLREFSITYLGC